MQYLESSMNQITSDQSAPIAFDYLAAARSILPRLEATSARSEHLRRLDDDAVAALRESGLTRLITPRRFGGFEFSPSAHIQTCAELAHACSAASWVLMVCVAHDYVVGRFPEECQREIYERDPSNLIAGTLAPQGTVTHVPGGWRLDGRWQFGSGCDHSPWFLFGARVINPETEGPLAYHVMVPQTEVMMDDTWHTLGMRGTGSKDLIVRDVFVPDYRAMPTYPLFMGLSPHATHATYRLPVMAGLSSMLCGTVLGTAERALERFVERTRERHDITGVSKAMNGNLQRRVAESGAELAEARRVLNTICDRFDAAVAADHIPMSVTERVELRFNAAMVVELSRRSVERIYAASGAHSVYECDPVQRAFRDINTACHHAIIDFDVVSELRGRLTLLGDIGENPRSMPLA